MSAKNAVMTAAVAVFMAAIGGFVAGCNSDPVAPEGRNSKLLVSFADDGDGDMRAAPAEAMAKHTLYYVTGSTAEKHKVVLTVPDNGSGPFPTIVWFHGGGFTSGRSETGGGTHATPTVSNGQGYAFANVNYTLMTGNEVPQGQNAFPMLVEDVLAAIRFLKANACEYNLDTTRFVATGYSAGGYLAAMVVSLSNATHTFDKGENLHVSSNVHAGVTWAGLTDLKLIGEHSGNQSMHDGMAGPLIGCSSLLATTCDPNNLSSTLTYVNANTPPIMMYHGTGDGIVPWQQSDTLVKRINQVAPGRAVFKQDNNCSGMLCHVASLGSTTEVYQFLSANLPATAGNMGCYNSSIKEYERVVR